MSSGEAFTYKGRSYGSSNTAAAVPLSSAPQLSSSSTHNASSTSLGTSSSFPISSQQTIPSHAVDSLAQTPFTGTPNSVINLEWLMLTMLINQRITQRHPQSLLALPIHRLLHLLFSSLVPRSCLLLVASLSRWRVQIVQMGTHH